jgi:DNA-binding transcriptional ArsR family regulator
MTEISPGLEIRSTFARGLGELRERNRLRVLEALGCGVPLSSAEISRLTGLSRTTVGVVIRELKRGGHVRDHGMIPPRHSGGRPGKGLVLISASTENGNAVMSPRSRSRSAVEPFQWNRLLAENLVLAHENAELRSILADIAERVAKVAPTNINRRHRSRRHDLVTS